MLRELVDMKLSMACGRVGSRFVQGGGFAIGNFRLGVALSRVAASGRLAPRCSVSGQSEGNAPVQRIEAEDNPFVKPLSNVYFVVPCRLCQGSGEMKCDVCDGQGTLARGGFHKRNPVAIARIVGSKWTAMETTFGWRHFHVHSKRRGPGKDWFLEMVSTCDETTRFWLNAKILKDRERWAAGWLQKEELLGMQGAGDAMATICKACKGCRTKPCLMCSKSADGLQSRTLDIIDV
ncbi:hypothetical protein M758_4G134800 [Ceratodon purpureus]|uniref:Uncharacterized protein n=1 Tax=Ceratodon purpureus TaxID=3225 RepID=A0A8T0IAH2_CERPU|nr:hypothetical protein KC19_4G133500 [Ceratodon purpureus]KAG0619370.1 hypothetical protein M758_4G134800 [Ceratodon purpureus]